MCLPIERFEGYIDNIYDLEGKFVNIEDLKGIC